MTEEIDLLFPIPPKPSRLYRQYFTAEEIRLLDATPADTLATEIHALRLLIRRVLAASARMKLSLKHHLKMLAAFCQAALTLASLVRFEFKQQPEPPNPLDVWAAALENEPL
ncbi:MAG TPA: hypothetical protein VFH29_04775 [Anaerolineales bacterium]|nr:hypothetical protein [Anaerolineales bacterium]